MMNIIVGIVTVIAAGFVLWIFRPSFRKSVEQPKYTMVENDDRFKRAEEQSKPADFK